MIIGITGPTGSGKSTALEVLADMGYEIIDCDLLYAIAVDIDTDLKTTMQNEFGNIFNEEGVLDRKKLASIVFNDPDKLKKLNEIIFPYMRRCVENAIHGYGKNEPGIAIEGINIIPSGIANLCDRTIIILADDKIRKERIMDRDNLTSEEADMRMSAQNPFKNYKRAKYVMVTNDFSNKDDWKEYIGKIIRRL